MCFVSVPHPIGMIPKAEVDAKADAAYDAIIEAATKWVPSDDGSAEVVPPYPAKRFKFTGTYADVNDLFTKRKWSLSLPIVPPTVEKVEAMLKGTKRDPAEVLWVVPPRQGILTVELVATLGVMAGAKPEHMPLLLAAVDAFSKPEAGWRGPTTTTAPTVPLLIISGPVIEKYDLNAGTGTAGPQNPVTNALGYFVNLVGDIVGGSVPPNFDKSTHGSAGDFVASVFVENPSAGPWKESWAEERGFKPTDSVLTVTSCYLPNTNVDHASVTSEELLNTFCAGIAGTASGVSSCFADYHSEDATNANNCTHVLIMLAAEHAHTMAKDFPTRRSIAEYIVKNTGLPYKLYAKGGYCVPPEGMNPGPDTFLPRFTTPDAIQIVVTGGPGKQSQFWVPFPMVRKPVSVLISD